MIHQTVCVALVFDVSFLGQRVHMYTCEQWCGECDSWWYQDVLVPACLADMASVNVPGYVGREVWPPEMLGYERFHGKDFSVAYTIVTLM